MLNSALPLYQVTHDPLYFYKLMYLDGTNASSISGGIIDSICTAIDDIMLNLKSQKHPNFLLLTAGKDKIADNIQST